MLTQHQQHELFEFLNIPVLLRLVFANNISLETLYDLCLEINNVTNDAQ